MEKTCTKCGETKEIKFFSKQTKGKFGVASECKICRQKDWTLRRSNNLEKYAAYARSYREKRKESYNAYEREYRSQYHKTLRGYSNKLYSNALNRAKKKGLEFDLDSDFVFKKLEPLICESTGFTLNIKTGENCKTNPLQPTIDRVDSSKGYIKDNIKIVCWWWNVMKQDWSEETVKELLINYGRTRN